MQSSPTTDNALPADLALIDTHCHLDMNAYAHDLDNVLAEAEKNGVRRIVTIGIDLASSIAAVELTKKYAQVYATVGVHPHEAASVSTGVLDKLAQLADSPKVVGYGEIGLDYVKNYAPRKIQQQAFSAQLDLAVQLNLPVIIHDREAHGDTMGLLAAHGPYPRRGIMHCFSGDVTLARQVIEMGFLISIPGIVTFKNATTLQEVVRQTSIEHLILETDGPFLAPVPFRGKRNTPGKMLHTARMIAKLKNMPLESVAEITTGNAVSLFRLPDEEQTND